MNDHKKIGKLKPGSSIQTEFKGKIVTGEFVKIDKDGDVVLRHNQNLIYRKPEKIIVPGEEKGTFSKMTVVMPAAVHINKRYEYVESMIRMVINNDTVSCVISGEGGLGKSHSVLEAVNSCNLVDGKDYVTIKGYSTPKGLYNTLYDNREILVIFDDCDEVLLDTTAKMILKAALDSFDKRIVSWVSTAPSGTIPNQFEFKGRIIFVSNMPMKKIDKSLLSRSLTIDLTLTPDEKIERLRTIIPKLEKDVPLDERLECLELVNRCKDRMSSENLNIRTLIKTIRIRKSNASDWTGMAEFMITHGCN
jgi:hypothetical protein